jgi:glucokinase
MSRDNVDSIALAACYLRNDTCQLTERDWKVSVSDMRGLEILSE